jgi:hypothetical protein
MYACVNMSVSGGEGDGWGWACPYFFLSYLLYCYLDLYTGSDSSLVCSGLVTYHQPPAHKRGGYGGEICAAVMSGLSETTGCSS